MRITLQNPTLLSGAGQAVNASQAGLNTFLRSLQGVTQGLSNIDARRDELAKNNFLNSINNLSQEELANFNIQEAAQNNRLGQNQLSSLLKQRSSDLQNEQDAKYNREQVLQQRADQEKQRAEKPLIDSYTAGLHGLNSEDAIRNYNQEFLAKNSDAIDIGLENKLNALNDNALTSLRQKTLGDLQYQDTLQSIADRKNTKNKADAMDALIKAYSGRNNNYQFDQNSISDANAKFNEINNDIGFIFGINPKAQVNSDGSVNLNNLEEVQKLEGELAVSTANQDLSGYKLESDEQFTNKVNELKTGIRNLTGQPGSEAGIADLKNNLAKYYVANRPELLNSIQRFKDAYSTNVQATPANSDWQTALQNDPEFQKLSTKEQGTVLENTKDRYNTYNGLQEGERSQVSQLMASYDEQQTVLDNITKRELEKAKAESQFSLNTPKGQEEAIARVTDFVKANSPDYSNFGDRGFSSNSSGGKDLVDRLVKDINQGFIDPNTNQPIDPQSVTPDMIMTALKTQFIDEELFYNAGVEDYKAFQNLVVRFATNNQLYKNAKNQTAEQLQNKLDESNISKTKRRNAFEEQAVKSIMQNRAGIQAFKEGAGFY